MESFTRVYTQNNLIAFVYNHVNYARSFPAMIGEMLELDFKLVNLLHSWQMTIYFQDVILTRLLRWLSIKTQKHQVGPQDFPQT